MYVDALVAEDGRVTPRPLPHRRRARDLGVRDLLRVAEVAGLDADRAQPQLAAAVRELLKELLERRAALAGDALGLARQSEPDGLLSSPR